MDFDEKVGFRASTGSFKIYKSDVLKSIDKFKN